MTHLSKFLFNILIRHFMVINFNTQHVFNSVLYQWTLMLSPSSALKQAIDSTLCAFCYVRPTLFHLLLQKVQILVPNMATDHSASISDDRKGRKGQTDDRSSEFNGEEWYCPYVLSEYKRLSLTEGQLLTVAAAARSPSGIQQLIESGLPTLLTVLITGKCRLIVIAIRKYDSLMNKVFA